MNGLRWALGFITILPVQPRGELAEGELGRAAAWFPVVGLGLGGLIPGLSSEPQAAPAGSAGTATKSSGPSTSELTTDNLTQSVQMHLEALGYTVGNTGGDLDTNTIIAISQFQAENGMKVTGEVTPQLLGILGAKVDSQ